MFEAFSRRQRTPITEHASLILVILLTLFCFASGAIALRDTARFLASQAPLEAPTSSYPALASDDAPKAGPGRRVDSPCAVDYAPEGGPFQPCSR